MPPCLAVSLRVHMRQALPVVLISGEDPRLSSWLMVRRVVRPATKLNGNKGEEELDSPPYLILCSLVTYQV